MFRLPKDTEINEEILKDFLNKHAVLVAERYKPLENMYMSNHEILEMDEKPAYKPDNRIVVNFAKYIVDTMDGFFIGNPVKVSARDDANIDDYVMFLSRYSNLDDINAELSKICSIFGSGYEMYYADEESELCVIHLRPTEAFIIYDESILERPMFFVRRYKDKDGKERGSISSASEVRYFFYTDGKATWEGEWESHFFQGVPATEYIGNEERQGLFEPVISMINAFNKAISEKANDVDYFADAYLKILGAEADEESRKNIRDNRIINFEQGERDGREIIVEFLEKPNADQSQENLIDRLEQLIFQISMVANLTDFDFGSSSGIALKYKLQSMSNLAKVKERKFTAGLVRRYKILFSHPSSRVSEDAWVQLTYRFTQNVPSNELEESQIARNLEGVVSKKTQLKVLSVVDNAKDELEQIKDDNKNLIGNTGMLPYSQEDWVNGDE